MRPRGEIRQAMAVAAAQIVLERRDRAVCGATWREIAQRATWQGERGVAFTVAKRTARDMVRSGELLPVGLVAVDHARRPMLALAPATQGERSAFGAGGAVDALAQTMRGWPAR